GLVAVAVGLAFVPAAHAGSWLPHPAEAAWSYQWSDSQYATTPTTEKVTIDKSSTAASFTLDWTTDGQTNPDGAVSSQGSVSFQQTSLGIVNTNWSSTPPPPAFPILCASLSSCGNSLASTFYNVIWGTAAPVLFEPLLHGLRWTTAGG